MESVDQVNCQAERNRFADISREIKIVKCVRLSRG